jgi:hypothetical protein
MKCPMCRAEYTVELVIDAATTEARQKYTTMKRILGKINMLFCQDEKVGPVLMTHYVTNVETFKLFKPALEIDDDNGESVILYRRC